MGVIESFEYSLHSTPSQLHYFACLLVDCMTLNGTWEEDLAIQVVISGACGAEPKLRCTVAPGPQTATL